MLSIGAIEDKDFEQTAELHKCYLKLGLFPRMGRNFLRHYQETFAKSPYGIALVAKDGDEVVGALFGTTSNADHYRWVVRNCGWELALAGGTALLTRPQLAWTFASTRIGRYMRGIGRYITPANSDGTSAPQGPRVPVSVLSHIVTNGKVRRMGIGRKLVEEFRARAGAEGARRAVLVTQEGGEGAPFFERIGCTCVKHRQGQDGAQIREYRLLLDEAQPYERIGTTRRGRNIIRSYHRPMGAAGGALAAPRRADAG
jgi:ribosomal protein S18 acetylase RimI-like enzyme